VAVAATVTYAARVATFSPAVNLAYNTFYAATIIIGATNSAGTPPGCNYFWSFRTITPTQNPELTPADRQNTLQNMTTITLASNRRVDITLSTTGRRSVRQYPLNIADSLALLNQAKAQPR
jgi:hypothetical protein